MRVWFAGNTGTLPREKMVIGFHGLGRLYSYHYVFSEFFNVDTLLQFCMKKKVDLFLDSGAFSAWSQGVEVDIQAYIDFIKQHEHLLTVYANLDVIGLGGKQPNRQTAEATLKNQNIMEDAGLNPLPCFHVGEPYSYLEYYIENYDYLAIGVAGNSGSKLIPWLDECFSKYICDKDGFPKIKTHGFAVTSVPLMLRYPWYSVDSTSWVVTGRNGSIFMPSIQNGKYMYTEASWKIAVSSRSPDSKAAGKHINTLSPLKRQVVMDYIHSKGYQLGKSRFELKSTGYKLQDNERWAEKKIKGQTERMVEIIEEPGISNKYQLRDEMNIIYFLDLEKSMPKYPWAFQHKKVMKGFL